MARLSNPDHAEAVDLDQDGRMDLIVADLGEVMPLQGDSAVDLPLTRVRGSVALT